MADWEILNEKCTNCKKCNLNKTRTNVVIGSGNINADLLLVGEGPGKQEDIQGIPFVGAAGKLLNLLLGALSITEDMYYITNIVKCRPPNNRTPNEAEAQACLPYLREQVMLLSPKIIVCMGATALKYLVDNKVRITQVRGQWISRRQFLIMPTFHPAALLRDESKKELMWKDFKIVKEKINDLLT